MVTPSDTGLEMERLGTGELLEADGRQRASASRVAHAGPGERRVEVVAAVHEEGPGRHCLADRQRRILVAGEHRGGEPELAVVHQYDRLVVARYRLHADHRAEAFLGHH